MTRAWIVAVLLIAASAHSYGQDSTATAQPPLSSANTPQQTQGGGSAVVDSVAAAKEAQRKRDAAAARKATEERAAQEKTAAEKASAEKAAAEKLAAEKAAAERVAAETAATLQKTNEKAAAEQAVRDKAAAAERLLFKRLLITTAISSSIAVILLTLPFFRRKPKPQPRPEEEIVRRLTGVASKLDAALQLVDEKLETTCDAIKQQLGAATLLTPAHLTGVATALGDLRDQVVQVRQAVEETGTRPASEHSEEQFAAFERKILDTSYKAFCANRELSDAVDTAVRENTWIPLIDDLNKVVPPDLKPTFEAVIAPCKEHWNLVQKIGTVVPKVIERKAGDLPAADEARRAREYANVLQTAQSGDGAARLTFGFKSWITDNFLTFADLYLQRYQQSHAESRPDDLQTGVSLVRQLLSLAAVEPIDVVPGETSFDSTRHIGRSTSNDPHIADGVITGVVRNGFIEGGQQVIRRPEVIVNRNR